MSRRGLARACALVGRGLFTGRAVRVVFAPAPPGAGYLVSAGGPPVPLTPALLRGQPHHSTLRLSQKGTGDSGLMSHEGTGDFGLMRHGGTGDFGLNGETSVDGRVPLPEHALAALVLLDLDDVLVRFEGGEAPIADGSAAPFVRALLAAGITGPPPRPALRVEVTRQGRAATWTPTEPPFPLASARTFFDLHDAARNRARFPGATPGCALLLHPDGSSRYGGRPRLPEEPLHHKLLDLLGDLAPFRARSPLRGTLRVADPSHASNAAAIRAALDSGALRSDAAVVRPPPPRAR